MYNNVNFAISAIINKASDFWTHAKSSLVENYPAVSGALGQIKEIADRALPPIGEFAADLARSTYDNLSHNADSVKVYLSENHPAISETLDQIRGLADRAFLPVADYAEELARFSLYNLFHFASSASVYLENHPAIAETLDQMREVADKALSPIGEFAEEFARLTSDFAMRYPQHGAALCSVLTLLLIYDLLERRRANRILDQQNALVQENNALIQLNNTLTQLNNALTQQTINQQQALTQANQLINQLQLINIVQQLQAPPSVDSNIQGG